jgi:hypothetical protein
MAKKIVAGDVAKRLEGMADWKRIRAMTDEDIRTVARLDPEARLLTPKEMAQFKRKGILDTK